MPRIEGTAQSESLQGTEFDDEIYGRGGDDRIDGLGGNDLIVAGDGIDTISGGSGNDTIYAGSGGEGSDADRVFQGVHGDGGDDWIRITGDGGDQEYHSLGGGEGFDTVEIDMSLDDRSIYGGFDPDEPGRGSFTNNGFFVRIGFSGFERLVYRGGPAPDSINGGTGDDYIDGGLSGDRMHGGAGNDTLVVDDAGDEVSGGDGVDTVRSSRSYALRADAENLTLIGSTAINGSGNDLANVITGNGASNLLSGNDGNDILDGGAGDDRMRGGRHDDTYIVDQAGDSVSEISGGLGGTDTVRSSVSFTLGDYVENLIATGGAAISATGNALANRLTGNGAANRLDGRAGADIMAGLAGDDTYVVDNAADQVIEASSAGRDGVVASISYTLPGHVEKLTLAGAAALNGSGNSGGNVITGNSAANVLKGFAGNDTLLGGTGNDKLYGGTGNDSLRGEGGADGFYFDTALGTSNVDRLINFTPADDTIFLDRAIFTGISGSGPLNPSAFRAGTAAGDSSDRIVYDQATGKIFYDADGTGAAAATLFATVTAGTALTHADFVIYG